MSRRRVHLAWDGKSESLHSLRGPVPGLEVEEQYRAKLEGDGPGGHRVVRGDALDTARALEREGLAGQVDLVYIDPPYGSGIDYRHEERLDGRAGGRVATAAAYRDKWDDGQASYLDMLFPRLVAMRPLLKPSGSIWIQVDWRASYLVRALCDEVFGEDRFLNEIVWRRAPNLGRQARSGQFGRTLDTLVVYGAGPMARLVPPERLVPVPRGAAKHDASCDRWFTLAPRGDYTDASVARLAKENRIYTSSSGTISVKYWLERDDEGRLCKKQPVDALWVDIPPLRHAAPHERTGYPTQKPIRLLERVVLAGSEPGGIVVNLFAGSGTTGAAAARLGRRFILGDESAVAIATMRSRLLRQGVVPLSLERCGGRHEIGRASIDVRPRDDDQVEIALHCEAGREPLAWAIDLAPAPGRPFRAHWHAERGTGRKPAALPLAVVLPRAARFEARVHFVDGKIAVAGASCATRDVLGPTSFVEAPT